MRKFVFIAAVCLALGTLAAAQADQAAELRRQFEAGKYADVVRSAEHADATAPGAGPVLFTAAEAFQRLNQDDRAMEIYERLAGLPEGNPWRLIGSSARALATGNVDQALNDATQAVGDAADQPEAHYQLGLVLSKKEDWNHAATEFARAAELDPRYAYAYYRAGMAYNKARRIDLMANAFEMFLKLAPKAPEAPAVQQIMRTVRGR